MSTSRTSSSQSLEATAQKWLRERQAKRLRVDEAKRLERAKTQRQRERAQRERWYSNPAACAEEGLGVELWSKQADILMALAAHDSVAVRSGHKVGKSWLVAIACLWWVLTRPLGKAIITNTTYQQVKTINWEDGFRQLAIRALTHGSVALPPIPKDPKTGIHWGDGRYIIGLSVDNPVSFGGYGGSHVLYVIDEASGVDDAIFEVIQGIRASGARDDPEAEAKILLTGNPTQTTGQFYRAFHSERGIWRPFHISSEQSPNVTAGKVVIPGLATKDYIEERRRSWGEDSDAYRVRVLGEFPKQGPMAVIRLDLVEKAAARAAASQPNGGRLVLGVDVARYGQDRSVAQPRRGNHLYKPRIVNGMAVDAVAGMVLDCIREIGVQPGERALVNVDTDGVGGGVADVLRDAPGIDVVDIGAGTKADDEDDFPNMRSQLWFAAGTWLGEGGALPADKDIRMQLEGELLAPEYTFDARGRRVVEPKAKTKSKLGRSPDLADALCLCVYQQDIDRTILRVPSRYS